MEISESTPMTRRSGLGEMAASRFACVAFLASLWTLACLLPGCYSASDSEPAASVAPSSEAIRSAATPQQDLPAALFDRVAELRRSERLFESERYAEAADGLQRVMLADPSDVEVIFLFANAQARLGHLGDAISLLESIPPDHPQAGLPAIGQAADWCFQAERYFDAEQKYLRILQTVPEAAIARRQLAYLYNRQGRRHEAAMQIQQLCRMGDVREHELHALLSLCDAIFDDPRSPPPVGRPPYFLIGPEGEARRRFTNRQYIEAASLLASPVAENQSAASVSALYGRCLAESQQEERFLVWLDACDSQVSEFSEYWAAWGTYLVDQHRFEEAVRALGESLRRDPTDMRTMRRIIQALVALGKRDETQIWTTRIENLQTVITAGNAIAESKTPDPKTFDSLGDGLIELSRPLEAIIWKTFGAFLHQQPTVEESKDELGQLNQMRAELAKSDTAFGSELQRLSGLDLDHYPLPKRIKTASLASPKPPAHDVVMESLRPPRFENIAAEIGLDHQYLIAAKPQDKGFAIYQQFGGGVAVIDYDMDGFADLYFAQGGSDPPGYRGTQSNLLYRMTNPQLRDVTEAAGAADYRYSIGVTSGDWNQDGFPDLVVGNLGANALMINNGDGTFRAEATDALDDATIMTTSLAMADVSGDRLPDIIELNYAHDAKLPSKPNVNSKGDFEALGPLHFQPANDRLLINDTRGERTVQSFGRSADTSEIRSSGLGVVVTNFDSSVGNEVFVGNDLRPNQFWKRNPSGDWVDLAPISGCASGHTGNLLASMGIAAGDIDGSGTLDLFITNFENEPNSLFLNHGNAFQDRSIPMNLAEHSFLVLGFGAQTIDFNRDGKLDLAVTNGNIENHHSTKTPYKQPAQLFVNLGSRLDRVQVIDPSHYFDHHHVGRALATLDFNRDGRTDFVITHMGATSALLINQTETDHHWLDVELIGTHCERDAIGAKIEIRAQDSRWTGWVMSGNGYLCRNESVVSFGFGKVRALDQVLVHWPDGEQQAVRSVPVDRRVLIVQGEETCFPRE